MADASNRLFAVIGEQYRAEIESMDKDLIQLTKVYLDDLRGVRMGIHTEVREILQTINTLRELSKIVPILSQLHEELGAIYKILTPEFIGRLKMLALSEVRVRELPSNKESE